MGYLGWNEPKYDRNQQTHCKRLISDAEMMETQLYAVIDFMADNRLAPKGIIEVSGLLEKVREMKRNFEDDLRKSKEKD